MFKRLKFPFTLKRRNQLLVLEFIILFSYLFLRLFCSLLRQLHADGFSSLSYRNHIIYKKWIGCIGRTRHFHIWASELRGVQLNPCTFFVHIPSTFLLFRPSFLSFQCSLMFSSCHLNCLRCEVLLFYQYWRLLKNHVEPWSNLFC